MANFFYTGEVSAWKEFVLIASLGCEVMIWGNEDSTIRRLRASWVLEGDCCSKTFACSDDSLILYSIAHGCEQIRKSKMVSGINQVTIY